MPIPRPCLVCKRPTTLGSRCEEHQLKKWRNAPRRAELQTSEWRALSKRRREMFPVCEVCGIRRSAATDHIIPAFEGGQATWENVQAICAVCHGTKTASEGHRARWAQT